MHVVSLSNKAKRTHPPQETQSISHPASSNIPLGKWSPDGHVQGIAQGHPWRGWCRRSCKETFIHSKSSKSWVDLGIFWASDNSGLTEVQMTNVKENPTLNHVIRVIMEKLRNNGWSTVNTEREGKNKEPARGRCWLTCPARSCHKVLLCESSTACWMLVKEMRSWRRSQTYPYWRLWGPIKMALHDLAVHYQGCWWRTCLSCPNSWLWLCWSLLSTSERN